MKEIKSVKLELLRHGPPHNQLLSPLTQYMGLCGKHEASTVRVPFEHGRFLLLLKNLRYGDRNSEDRKNQLKHMAAMIAEIFHDIPGLIADINAQYAEDVLLHLRLVFSAAELGLLPFELAQAAPGIPGEGMPLSLQLEAPLVMTREVRGANGSKVNWDRKPKILFAYAAPPKFSSVPYKAHLLALRKAIGPWIGPEDGRSLLKRISDLLVVAPDASLDSIRKVCESNDITHVHILAHGMQDPGKSEPHFGLGLFNRTKSEAEFVDGWRLSSALRSIRKYPLEGLSQPIMVTLASCDSGHRGPVVHPSSGLMHTIHEAGVPLVIGSQFPLTKSGSVRFADTIYSRMLWGEDPRACLFDLRQRLRQMDQNTHDWASLIAYASLPDNLADQLRKFKESQARSAMTTCLRWASNLTKEKASKRESWHEELSVVISKLSRAISWIPDIDPKFDLDVRRQVNEREWNLGTLGSAEKRKAQALYFQSRILENQDDGEEDNDPSRMGSAEKRKGQALFFQSQISAKKDDGEEDNDPSRIYLEQSLEAVEISISYYQRILKVKPHSHWAGTQVLSLKLHLDNVSHKDESTAKTTEMDFKFWEKMREHAKNDMESGETEEERLWAYPNYAELELLGLICQKMGQAEFKTLKLDPITPLKKFVERSSRDSMSLVATWWQLNRYKMWFHYPQENDRNIIEGEVNEMMRLLRRKIGRIG